MSGGSQMAIRYLAEWSSIHQILLLPDLDLALDIVQRKRCAHIAYTVFMDKVESNRCEQAGVSTPIAAKYFTSDLTPLITEAQNKIHKINYEMDQIAAEVQKLGILAGEKKKEVREAEKVDYSAMMRSINNEKRKIEQWLDENAVNQEVVIILCIFIKHIQDDLYFDDEIRDKTVRIENEMANIQRKQHELMEFDQAEEHNEEDLTELKNTKETLNGFIAELKAGKSIVVR